MFLIGLTGSIGTGKTTVSNYLKQKNIPLIDSDQIARDVVEPNSKCWKLIRKNFGSESINSDGQINRPYLAQIIFNDPEKRRLLNSITHPEIQKRTLFKIIYYYLTFCTFIVLDIPLLFEASVFTRYMSYIIVVKCDSEEQLRRIKERNHYTDEEAKSRILSQMPIEEKCRLANFIIDNNGTIEETYKQVDQLLNELKIPKIFWIIRLFLLIIYSLLIIALFILIKWVFKFNLIN